MASRLSRTTTDHEEIRRWAEERGAVPSEVEATERDGETGIIRLDFPGYSGEGSLKPISWDEWFEKFDRSNLALVYQERTGEGQQSNFNKLVARETAEARAHGDRKASRRSLRGRGSRTGTRRGATAARARRSTTGGKRGAGTRSRSRTKATARGAGRSGAGRTAKRAASRTGAAGRQRTGSSAARREAPRAIVARLTGHGHLEETGSRGGRRGTRAGKRAAPKRTAKRGGGRRSGAGARGRRSRAGRSR